ncbi:MAG TPA: hypothetical protein VM513_13555 [Kofleriaceae bacterium]|nr:hypothetical protein [Kofleriaceae bacterium]
MSRLPLLLVLASVACKSSPPPKHDVASRREPAVNPLPERPTARVYNQISRTEFNRWAVRENLPLYWIRDTNNDGALTPDELTTLLFYPPSNLDLDAAYARIVAAAAKPVDDVYRTRGQKREALVGKDLDQGRPTLVMNDLSGLSADDKKFVGHMMVVADLIDDLYETHNGAAALASELPDDAASHSLFRRNRGPKCVGPATEKEPLCSAIPGAPKPVIDLYPAELQTKDKWCQALEARKDAKTLLTPFTAVRAKGADLVAVPYTEAYPKQMQAIAAALGAAADSVKDPSEQALVAYLRAAAEGFKTNNWVPADEAWAKMTVDNSKWYVRVAPDEVYWEPCAAKAGFHLSFARINQGSRAWQQKLVPVQQDMENAIAKAAGRPYLARKVTFHLPDFIDIVVNAGDDRTPLGATIGQSLPNWGPVANEGRGRTVAMVNLYSDPDSLAARRSQAESMLDATSMTNYTGTQEPGLLSTILHEATHNLGPAHEYKVRGKKDDDVFGGPLASVMEELKAQTGALFLLELLRSKGVISDELARQSYADAIVWALGHISQGMYTGTGERKTYSNVAAIQIGMLLDAGALKWDANATAANGSDKGALVIDYTRITPVVNDMMKKVASIKAQGNRAGAEALSKRYVDGTTVPHAVIAERFLRFPKASFVYAVKL